MLLEAFIPLEDVAPLLELAVGVGLGLSIFIEPYTSGREKINEQLATAERIYSGLPQESPKWVELHNAADRLETAEEAMTKVVRAAITCSLFTSALALLALIIAITIQVEISIALAWLAVLFFTLMYGGAALGVTVASRYHFGKVHDKVIEAFHAPAVA